MKASGRDHDREDEPRVEYVLQIAAETSAVRIKLGKAIADPCFMWRGCDLPYPLSPIPHPHPLRSLSTCMGLPDLRPSPSGAL